MVADVSQLAEKNEKITRLQRLFEAQRAAFMAAPMPTAGDRIEQLKALAGALKVYEVRLAAAVSEDFGHRSTHETYSAELLTALQSIRYVRKNLRRWMRPERRDTSLLMMANRAEVMYQPLGVIGIIAPWNYPILMAVRPLIYALAAGNRAMIKPSEYTPRTSELLREMLASVYSEDQVAVCPGDADVGVAFSKLPFDHILFTGSSSVGKHIMRAAAENLTPVTLELGGKCPTVISEDVSLSMAAERICFAKSMNAGQTCVAPDYILCPRGRQDELIAELQKTFTRFFPDFADSIDYTSVSSDRQHVRLQGLIDDALSKGAHILSLCGGEAGQAHSNRRVALQLLSNLSDDMEVLHEEIFGPLMPIVPYETLEEAVAFINARPRPLALNIFDNNAERRQFLIDNTHSGGVCINDAVFHVAVDDLPFGGVGASGMGRYHGEEGFRSFSNAKSVFHRPHWFNSARTLHPPYGNAIQRLVHRLFMR